VPSFRIHETAYERECRRPIDSSRRVSERNIGCNNINKYNKRWNKFPLQQRVKASEEKAREREREREVKNKISRRRDLLRKKTWRNSERKGKIVLEENGGVLSENLWCAFEGSWGEAKPTRRKRKVEKRARKETQMFQPLPNNPQIRSPKNTHPKKT
jgi:hypothetical protein